MSDAWMPLFIGDYKRDTGHLHAIEHGAYLCLIMHYWTTGKLPTDDAQLSRIACVTAKEWRAIKPTVQAFFSPEWRHFRIENELATAREKHEKRANAGSRGGKAKALKSLETTPSNAKILPEVCQPVCQPDAVANACQSQSQPQSQGVLADSSQERAREIDLRKRLTKLFAHRMIPPESGRAAVWLAQGYDPEIIVAVVSEIVGRRPDAGKQLSYFDKPIEEAHDKRATAAMKAAAPKPTAAGPTIEFKSGAKWPVEFVVNALRQFHTSGGYWPRTALGPQPGEAGCDVPADLLAQYAAQPVEVAA